MQDKSSLFLSFIPLLKKYLDLTKPKLILEWGPGVSTEIMMRHCPDAQIHTIEHDQKYFQQWRERFRDNSNIHVYFIPLDKYAIMPLFFRERGKFDFVFVDGRKRVACMQVALKVAKSGAIIMLHDSERPHYAEGKALFRIVEESDGTAVMKK